MNPWLSKQMTSLLGGCMSKQTAAAYAAGIIDGEGSFTIGREFSRKKDIYNIKVKKCWYRLQIQISNTNKEVLHWFQNKFGGLVFQTKPTVTGLPVYHWNLNGANKKTEKFLLATLPYLIVKRRQALVALDFCRLNEPSSPEEKQLLRDSMFSLNRSGPSLPLSPTTNMSNSAYIAEKIESDLHSDVQNASVMTQIA